MLWCPASRRMLTARLRRGHVRRAVPGADLRGVLGEGGVSHVVQPQNFPSRAKENQQRVTAT